ncbi:DUF6456 domain-containing protein [Brevundimonas sp. PAMC22021]|uniref:DUF6456 domain-containing protein n=1 Tax=Brevundimonas sp. PAMC22021 TaxID=2861285 RepID=UPI001C633B61|nr:DUF6456 domain-containing protein [Brevundimonas sp. PAMC22021]QYF86061.1 hypothetical protein KY493_09355 [Brevundimonas sp. PAMC22021]
MSAGEGDADHRLARLRGLIVRPGAWLDAADGRYRLRVGRDRRTRITTTLDEAEFRALAVDSGLKARDGGGWVARRIGDVGAPSSPPPGRPGMIEGERLVMEADGRLIPRRANLGESPILWLARRKDASGRPWLTPVEVAAGERLRRDGELAAAGPSLTMRWDALPRSGGGSGVRVEPGDLALSASRRVEAALDACGPRLRPIVGRICIVGDSLQLAETGLGLRRRQGKTLLKQGLQALAEHYGFTEGQPSQLKRI